MTTDMALKGVYLEPMRRGVKTIEYRDLTEYYVNKLVDVASYNKPIREIMDGLHDGTLELKTKDITHIMFHESKTGVRLKAEVRYIKVFKGHHCFCIGIGKVEPIYDNNGRVEEG